ncbi:phosphotransferase [Bacillus sp. FJAT-49736]|uniref:phosphotransferase enzyme family protein n=1 Tax=Bacillus sp. FJAT-49736 TaxID=2833582 RepID=UPI001BC9AC59|nr:phosphotransferase [Bacillus sp. FJAT-49736]MBS4173044.1 phosphotransferase [Bacillus sp. FJAT-49736]
MMKLSTMRKVVETVNEEWRSPFAEEILERWGYDKGSVYYFRSSANFVFIFKKEGVTHFLRFNESSEREKQWMEAEIEILLYLQGTPVKVVKPVKSRNQQFIESIHADNGEYFAVVFEGLPGKQYEIEDLSQDQYVEWGRALGQLHQSLQTLPEHLNELRPHWLKQLSQVKKQLPQAETAALKELEQIIKWAKTIQIPEKQIGMIHFDFELDNLRWDGGTIGILDFDDCSIHWYGADILFALRDVMGNGVNMENPCVRQFLLGYTSVTEIDSALWKDAAWFKRVHNILSFTRLYRAVDIDISENDPNWLIDLSHRLTNLLDNYRRMFTSQS